MLRAAISLLCLLIAEPCRAQESVIARVPLRQMAGLIVFEARLAGGQPCLFLLDSGSSGAVIDTHIADQVKLPRSVPEQRRGAVQGSNVAIAFAKQVSLEIHGTDYDIATAAVAQIAPLARAVLGVEVGGILGHAFFKRFVVEIDYIKSEMTLHDPAKYVPAEDATVVPIRFNKKVGGLPFADVDLDNGSDDPVTVSMLVDSGGQLYATGGIGSKADIKAMVPASLPVYEGRGATGLGNSPENIMHATYAVRFRSMKVFGHEVKGPLISWSDKSVAFGVLGAQLMSRFDVVFDYRNKRLLVRPNKRFGTPLLYDASGLVLLASGTDVGLRRIVHVVTGSAAEKAGFAAGDEIVAFDGSKASEVSLLAMRDVLCKRGDYRVRVRRGDEFRSLLLATEKIL